MKIGLGIGIPFIRNYISSLFDPSKLFTGSTNGVWYDPSDITTLYRDAAGTLPVTAVEQPVGLMLDKSKGLVLGSEIIVDQANRDFSSDTGWWSKEAGVSISNGTANWTASLNNNSLYRFNVLTVGLYYEVTFTVTSISSGGIRVYTPSGSSQIAVTTGTYTVRICAVNATLGFTSVGTTTASIDNVSVKQVIGNHAFNSSGNSANFPVLSARVNRLTETNPVSGSTWTTLGGVSFSTNSTVAPDGTTTGTVATTTTPSATYYQAVSVTPGEQYTFSMAARRGTMANAKWSVYNASAGSDIVTATSYYGSLNSSTWTRVTLSFTIPAGCTSIRVYPLRDSGSIGTIEVWGADLRAANDALNQPAYQRVNTATDYDTVGFKPYLRFNGTNQWLQTNSINFTYGDKMFVSAGVRKFVDGTPAVLFEYSVDSANNSGAFAMFYPVGSVLPQPAFRSGGSTQQLTYPASGYAAPITNVLSGIGNISGDQSILRVNGTQAAISTSDQGTGNYGNYPLYIGARAGTSLWFNGRLYSLIVAGKLANAVEITETEKYVNGKTAAY